jgi:xanthine dehydrogenase accessory factor
MKDILPELEDWLAQGENIALATVVRTWGSSPRGVGAKMALTAGGKIAGSVSGGCVEGAVFEAGIETLKTGQPQLLHFGVADETAWTVGLACGGQIDVFVQPLQAEHFQERRKRLAAGQLFAAATVIRGPVGLLGCELLANRAGEVSGAVGAGLDEAAAALAGRVLSEGVSQVAALPGAEAKPEPAVEVFVEVVEPQPVLVIVGAVHTAIALARLAQVMGFRTVVVDPRSAFGNAERFPQVDQLLPVWPQDAFAQVQITERTAIAILTHDPKIDDPALEIALASPAFYVGALGSATTQAARHERLLQAGVSEQQLARLHGPIGLKLGGQAPEEIALAVMAEITAVKNRVIS